MRIARLPVVKICCISSVGEARTAIAAGASALGLVSAMPSGPGVLPETRIAEIVMAVPPPIETFLLTSRQDAIGIAAQHRRCGTSTIQLVDHVTHHELQQLRHLLPGVKLVQVIHVTSEQSFDEACAAAPFVDALLLDSGNQALPVKELGGTGRTHDWRLSRRIRAACTAPVFLAGGLNCANVAEAVNSVAPFGIDLCTGVRTQGRLDPVKLHDFFNALRSGATS